MNDHRIPGWLFWILLFIHGFAALPAYALLVAFVPRFAGLFDRLASDGGLPALTYCVMLLSKYVHPLFLFALALDGLVLSKLSAMPRNFWLTLAWFIAVLAAMVVLLVLTFVALLLPVWTMSATI